MKLSAGAFVPSSTSNLKIDSVGFTPSNSMNTEVKGFVPNMTATSFTPNTGNSFYPGQNQTQQYD